MLQNSSTAMTVMQGDFLTDLEPDVSQPNFKVSKLAASPFKDEMSLMEYPFFSTSKGDKSELIYQSGNTKIKVRPSIEGVATVWDLDVLVFIASLINKAIEEGVKPSRTVIFKAGELLSATRRAGGKKGYEDLRKALFRLRGTTIETNIEADNLAIEGAFSWLQDFQFVMRKMPNGARRMEAVSVTVSEWLFRKIVGERSVLSVSPDFFGITSGVGRRIYSYARKKCGRQESYIVSLSKLHQMIGVRSDKARFRRMLVKLEEEQSLPAQERTIPQYNITLLFSGSKKPVHIMGELSLSQKRRVCHPDNTLVCFTPRREELPSRDYYTQAI